MSKGGKASRTKCECKIRHLISHYPLAARLYSILEAFGFICFS